MCLQSNYNQQEQDQELYKFQKSIAVSLSDKNCRSHILIQDKYDVEATLPYRFNLL